MRKIIALILMATISCSSPNSKDTDVDEDIKNSPEYSIQIADPQLKLIVDSYFEITKRNDLYFSVSPSIGFKEINRENVIGTCTYGGDWREIDIDAKFWSKSDFLSKVTLVYHELTHCLCNRDHDWGDGEKYPNEFELFLTHVIKQIPISPFRPKGYFDDWCPLSIMHPTIMPSQCFEDHYSYYLKEMLNRCDPQ